MATLFPLFNPISHSFTFPSLRAPPSRNSSPLLLTGCRRPRPATVVTRAGASTSSYAFAIALPLSLLGITVFTALRIGQKLDQDFYEEVMPQTNVEFFSVMWFFVCAGCWKFCDLFLCLPCVWWNSSTGFCAVV